MGIKVKRRRENMKTPDTKQIAELTEKLKSQGDITEREAESMRSLFYSKRMKTELNPKSSKFNPELFDAFMEFTNVALNMIKHEKAGIFLTSFVFPSRLICREINELLQEILEKLPLRDRISIFNTSYELFKPEEGTVNGINIRENMMMETWVFLNCGIHDFSFYGYNPGCLGAFRRSNLRKAFKNYADIPVVFDPFRYFAAGFFFEHADFNITDVSDILSDAVICLINSQNIPFLLYGDMDPKKGKCREEHIAVDAGLARRITKAVRKHGKDIIAEMKESGIIYPPKDIRLVYYKTARVSGMSGADRLKGKGFNRESWYEFDDYYRMIDFARDLLCEAVKYDKIINRARDKEAEEDIWITEGR
jgi:hypothetical protein